MTRAVILMFAAIASACAPELDDRPYLVDWPRLIAVIAEPPEVRPREAVTVTPVVVGPGADRVHLTFRFCNEPLPVADPRPVSEACFSAPGIPLEAQGKRARGEIPADACARFGPDPADGKLRPSDPDATGGFYQPIIVEGLLEPTVVRVRIHCPLPDVAADLGRDFEEHYAFNTNPQLTSLNVVGPADHDGALHAGVSNQLRVTWTGNSIENYALVVDAGALEHRDESLRLSWFTTGGRFASSATGPDLALTSASLNAFTPADTRDHSNIWVVLQDSRGGADAMHWRFENQR